LKGLHVVVTGLEVNQEQAKQIAEALQQRLPTHIAQTIDTGVYKNGLRILGCKKGIIQQDDKRSYLPIALVGENAFPNPGDILHSFIRVRDNNAKGCIKGKSKTMSATHRLNDIFQKVLNEMLRRAGKNSWYNVYKGAQHEAISMSSDGSVCFICRSCKRCAQKEQAYGLGSKHQGKSIYVFCDEAVVY